MAPAAQSEQSQIYTSKHDTHVTQTAAPDHATARTSKSKQTRTMTETKLVTITLGEPIPTPSSPSPALLNCVSLRLPRENAIVPHINGIVPRSPLSLHSPPSASVRIPTITTTVASLTPQQRPSNTLQPTTFRTSSYPHPSPPGFLYPETVRIVPLHAMPSPAYTHTTNMIWYLPYGLEIPIFVLMLMGLAWAVLVWLVKSLQRTWSCESSAAKEKGKQKSGKKRREILLGWCGEEEERRPIDKPSKYAPRTNPTHTIDVGNHTSHNLNTTSTPTPKIYIHANAHLPTNDLTYRCHSVNRRISSAPNTAVGFSLSTSSPTTPTFSPPNPFMQPPDFLPPHTASVLKPRSSSEWLADRENYFSTSTSSHSRTPSTTSSNASGSDSYNYGMDTAAMEALEAGVPSPTARSPTGHKRQGSWVNLGLDKVEGAVNSFTDRLARWTDELDRGEKENGWLLPVSEMKGIKVE
jgi:hypothetical protein